MDTVVEFVLWFMNMYETCFIGRDWWPAGVRCPIWLAMYLVDVPVWLTSAVDPFQLESCDVILTSYSVHIIDTIIDELQTLFII